MLRSDRIHVKWISLNSWSPHEEFSVTAWIAEFSTISIVDLAIAIELVKLLLYGAEVVLSVGQPIN
jgi:hypothetical protein